MKFDRTKFFDGYRDAFSKLSQQQVRGLERLLTCIEADPFIKDVRWAAYMLATVKRETASTYQPIHEYGGKNYFIKRYGGQTRKGKELGNDTPEEGYFYAGKGDVQLTGEANYEKAEAAIRREYPQVVADFERRTGRMFDLTVGDQPNDELDTQNVMDPVISYVVMSYGMRTGMFTGHTLARHIKGTKADYEEARRIINGTDHAEEIAADAVKFEGVLRKAKTSDSAAPADDSANVSASHPPLTDPAGIPSPGESPTPQPAPTEIKTTEAVQTAGVTSVIETTAPAGDAPDVPPTLVSQNGTTAKWLFSSGTLTMVGTAVWAWMTNNANVIAVAVICVAALIAMFMFRGAITDAIRMQTAADPNKKNVT
jgi:putative chitinase